MKLIVGLGNPGIEYERTRHNMGFMIIDSFAKLNNVTFSNNKFNGLYTDFILNGEKVVLLKPQSYMNLSGEVVAKFVSYFKIDVKDILVISDDLDLDYLKLKLKYKGSCGGHNGLRNIEFNLGTSNYKRLKVGIANDKSVNTKDYVLGKLNDDDYLKLNDLFSVTNNILSDYLKLDFEHLMSKYN